MAIENGIGGVVGYADAARRVSVTAALILAAALIAGISPANAGDSVTCRSVWQGSTISWGTWPGGIDSIMCELYEPASSELTQEFGVDIKIYLPGETQSADNPEITQPGWLESPHPDAPRNTPQLFAEAIRKTLSSLRPYMDPIPVQLVLLWNISGQGPSNRRDDKWGWDVGADTDAYIGSEGVCPVTIFITSVVDTRDGGNRPVDPRDIKATVAHEIFHCYQLNYFRRQEHATSEALHDGWWVEGTAEFVASQLYPCNETSNSIAGTYDMGVRLNRQGNGYPAYIFYTHLADRYGFDFGALTDFLGGMPTTRGQAAQNRALSAYPDIGAKFHSFAQDYIDGHISHCVSENAHKNNLERLEANNGLEVSLDAKPFTFGAKIVTLQAGKSYTVSLVDADAGDGVRKTSWREVGTGSMGLAAWSELNGDLILKAGCSDSKQFVFTSTVEATDENVHHAILRFRERQTDPASGPVSQTLCRDGGTEDIANDCNLCELIKSQRGSNVDNCLVGKWELQSGLWEHEVATIKGLAGDIPITLRHSGDRMLYIRKDGTLEYPGFRMERAITQGDGGLSTSSFIQPGSGEWNAVNGKINLCVISEKENVTQKIESPEGSFPLLSKTRQKEQIVSGNYEYSCGPKKLTITARGSFPGSGPPQWVYQRVTGSEEPCFE